MAEPQPSPLAQGVYWASRLTGLGLEFVLPALGGHYLDRRMGTEPLWTLAGAILGFGAGLMHLLRIVRSQNKR